MLNKVERFKSFIYDTVHIAIIAGNEALIIDIRPRSNSKPRCHECGKRFATYDRQPKRLFEHVPIWTFKVYFRYAPRRVSCPDHGIKVEAMPWANGRLSSGAVEGLNLKAKLTMRKAYGFKTLKCLEIALYHTLGDLPEPEHPHRFC